MRRPLSIEEFQELTSVSRETLDRLRAYLEELRRWQTRINLVARSTLADPWQRHFLDSAQLHPHISQPTGPLLDLGSGAGFPGMVLAILGLSDVHLIERDTRKAAFLEEVSRITAARVTVHAVAIEDLNTCPALTITARACAPLDQLLLHATRFLKPQGLCLFLKGRTAEQELTRALKSWTMDVDRITSLSDPNGTILCIRNPHCDRPPFPAAPH